MIKNIITDEARLKVECNIVNIVSPVFPLILKDLMDTANSLRDKCAGLAFNQIGEQVRGFAIKLNGVFIPVINPEYVMKNNHIKSRLESCLSLPGREPIRKRRHMKVKIRYYDPVTKTEKTETFRAFDARVAQHEMDHLNGILI